MKTGTITTIIVATLVVILPRYSHCQTNAVVECGFCFIDGLYVEPPYAVTTRDNVVLVNEIPVSPRLPDPDTTEGVKRRHEQNLAHIELVLFFTKDHSCMAPGLTWTRQNLKLMIDILSAAQTTDEKVSQLQRLSLLPLYWDETKTPLVTIFRPSKNLDARVNALLAEQKLVTRQIKDLPVEPQIVTEQRMKRQKSAKRVGRGL